MGRQEWYLSVTPPGGFSCLVLVESLVNIDGHISGMSELMRGQMPGPFMTNGMNQPRPRSSNLSHRIQWVKAKSVEDLPLALAQALRELVALGERIYHGMLEIIPELCQNPGRELIDKALSAEDEAGDTYREIFAFLSAILALGLTDVQAKEVATSLLIGNDLKHMGDAVAGFCQTANRLDQEGKIVPPGYWEEMAGLYDKVIKNTQAVISALGTDDLELAERVVLNHPGITDLQQSLRITSCLPAQRELLKDEDNQMMMYHYEIADLLLDIEMHTVNIARAILGLV
jgi:Na+/phosphate symporter